MKQRLKPHILTGLAGCLLLAGCTPGSDIIPEKRAEIIIYGSNQKAIANAVVRTCDSSGMHIESNTENMVTCSSAAGLGAQLMMRSTHGTEVQSITRFNIFGVGTGAYKVTADAALETQNAFGQTDKVYQKSSGNTAQLMYLLQQVKAKLGR